MSPGSVGVRVRVWMATGSPAAPLAKAVRVLPRGGGERHRLPQGAAFSERDTDPLLLLGRRRRGGGRGRGWGVKGEGLR